MAQVTYADQETAKELAKAGQGFRAERVRLVDGTEAWINKQNGDGVTAYYQLQGQGNKWITCNSVEKRLI
jgi:hypothetical protein